MGATVMIGLEDAPYAELHLHTCYSLLEGASTPKELIVRAARHGYDALAITDRNNLYGAMVFARACRDAGIRSIIGVELTVAGDPDVDPDSGPDANPGSRHDLTLLAETRQGYANLCRLVSLANGWGLAGQADRERRRRDPCAALHHVREHTAGVVCLTGGRRGELAQRVAAGDRSGARDVLHRWVDWFGPENVWVELHDNLVQGDQPRIRVQVSLARELGV
ncbi:MAG TPA: PHP domain-containing protein, partial [Acidimicrobiales bacterium]